MSDKQQSFLSSFEEDYLFRTLGNIVQDSSVAITELVANAWDAGASKVEITIPDEKQGKLIVEDDGSGMTPKQFKERWMKLGYNRSKRQGNDAEFPPGRESWKRSAYGRNGVGRHGMICFADEYKVETRRDGTRSTFDVQTISGPAPFKIASEATDREDGHGTRLSAIVSRSHPDPERLIDILSNRFLHDPQFRVLVNKKEVDLAEHSGLIEQKTLAVSGKRTVEVVAIDTNKARRKWEGKGIAFWVNGRLVGEASWQLGDTILLDRRTTLGKRLTIVVRCDKFHEDVLRDWTGFKNNEAVERLQEVVADYAQSLLSRLLVDRINANARSAVAANKEELSKLRPHARIEVTEFAKQVSKTLPTASSDVLAAAVKAVVNLEKSRSGQALLEKLSIASQEDVEQLNKILDTWTIQDAAIVLDEIDRRICVIEALEKVMDDPHTDELHTIHPLITQARWLFGPEFESPLFSSNVTIRTAAKEVFKKNIDRKMIDNDRKRPDLIFLKDATVSLVATEEFDESSSVTRLSSLLLLELKRGDSTIGREEMSQAEEYVEDLLSCGLLDGPPFIRAFVVGKRPATNIHTRTIGRDPEQAVIEPTTFGQLTRTARVRLFHLQERINDRVDWQDELEFMEQALDEQKQLDLDIADDNEQPSRAAS